MNYVTNSSELHVIFGAGPLGRSVTRELGEKCLVIRRERMVRIGQRSDDAERLAARGERYEHQRFRARFENSAEMMHD